MHAFISHASQDNALASRLESELETAGLDVWTDLSEIRAGALLGPQLLGNLRDSRMLLLLWSRSSADSRWVAVEWLIAFHEGKLVVPCVLDDTPLPQCLRNAVHIDLRGSWAGVAQELSRTLEGAPTQPTRVVVPARGRRPPELCKLIGDVSRGQQLVLDHLKHGRLDAARQQQQVVDKLVERATSDWAFDTLVVTLKGYHLKNQYQIEHHDEIQAGRRPRDPVLDCAERRFFEALSIDPTDHAALNGMGNYLWFLCEYEAAETFTLKAIERAKGEGSDTSNYEHDLGLIQSDKAANAPKR